MNKTTKTLVLVVSFFSIFLSGCGEVLMPYQSKSLCNLDEYGECLPINEAYEKALDKSNETTTPNNYSLDTRTDINYELLKNIVPDGGVPLLQDAVVRRVLIISYQSEDSTQWHEPRHIYYIEKMQWFLDLQNQNNDNQNNLNIFN